MYLLLNKNKVWAKFNIESIAGYETINIERANTELIYPWIRDLATFILNRKAPKHRENITELLKKSGCNTLSGYLNISHALSLTDTLWVKREEERINWEDISLYRNPFNSTIARMAFDGGLYGQQFSTTSPEFGTGGTFAKCWIRENGKIKMVKRGSEGYSNSGIEPYSEFYSSHILREFGSNTVDYKLTKFRGKLASKCDLFTSEKYGLVPFGAFTNSGNIAPIVAWYSKHNMLAEFSEMIVSDALILNQDRHLDNFGFLFDTDTGALIKPAPLYDHNISLLCYASDSDLIDDQTLLNYYNRVNFGPKLYDNFITNAKRLMTPELRKRLIRLKGIELKKHSRYNLSDWRLSQLSKIINNQINLLLA